VKTASPLGKRISRTANICNIKYQKDIGWVRQNTTLYYGVGCPNGDYMFRPFTIRPSSGLTWWKP